MKKIRCFRDLRVWNEAHSLAREIYQVTQKFPKDERYGLTSQLRRAAVSISSNIAEGSKRSTTKDLCHFLYMAQGSTEEVKSHLILAENIHYLNAAAYQVLFRRCQHVGILLNGLLRSLKL
jgi:four helix bundle protein